MSIPPATILPLPYLRFSPDELVVGLPPDCVSGPHSTPSGFSEHRRVELRFFPDGDTFRGAWIVDGLVEIPGMQLI
jgi:hypothetical protein